MSSPLIRLSDAAAADAAVEVAAPAVGTVDWLAARIGRSPAATLRILREFEAQGIAAEKAGVWRLTPDADSAFGNAFRLLPLQDATVRDVALRLPRSLR